jgi:LacI family transcriptional regulator
MKTAKRLQLSPPRAAAGKPLVALLLPVRSDYLYQIIAGITDFSKAHRFWRCSVECLGDIQLADLKPGIQLDGIIGYLQRLTAPELPRLLKACGVPAVDVSPTTECSDFPQVAPDDELAGRMVARYFLERGFRHFGYCGFREGPFSHARQAGFVSEIEKAGFTCSVYLNHDMLEWNNYRERGDKELIASWLQTLPKPAAVMACADWRARHLLMGAEIAGFRVPEEISLVSVDDDAIFCQVLDPPLSSAPLDPRRIGYEAAAILARLMAGKSVPDGPVLIPPRPVITRRSSDVFAIKDHRVAQSVRFIWQHVAEPIGVSDVVEASDVSLRSLQLRFKRELGRSVHGEIFRVRIERAKRLLAETNLTMPKIAEACGFAAADQLSRAFRRETGQTPTAYRVAQRAH